MLDTLSWLFWAPILYVWDWVWYVLAAIAVLHLLSYFVLYVISTRMPVPELGSKYSTKWALVTGGSSGIGKAISTALAEQGLNIVLVSLEDKLLVDFHKELVKKYPKQQFRAVGVDLTGDQYMDKIVEDTKDLDIGLVFNNAGYIVTGFFDRVPLDRQLKNLECNATSAVKITHHFYNKIVADGRKGAIVFTSSPAGYLPSAFSVMYGASKAFVSEFAACLAVEAKSKGVDVMAFHPSPVKTRFYDNAHKLNAFDVLEPFFVKPEDLPNAIFRGIGRTTLLEIGGFAVMTKMLFKVVDFGTSCYIFSKFAHLSPDYQKYSKE